MLDDQGFVSELNDTNLFMTKDGIVLTPFPNACLHGITRGLVIELCRTHNLSIAERNLSLTEFYNADEVFASGTMGELTPVNEIDGRKIVNRSGVSILPEIRKHFEALIPTLSEPLLS
jgi:branched-chain amino acid aminotransferase